MCSDMDSLVSEVTWILIYDFFRQNIVTFEVYVPFFSVSFLKLLSVTCHIYKIRYHLHRGIVTSSNSQWEKFMGRKSSDKNIELRLLG